MIILDFLPQFCIPKIINNYHTAHWQIRPQYDNEQVINKLQPFHQNEIWVLHEKHDEKDTTIACVPKLPFFEKLSSFNAFLEQNWLGVSFQAVLIMLLVPK